jgi:hypothetical protein
MKRLLRQFGLNRKLQDGGKEDFFAFQIKDGTACVSSYLMPQGQPPANCAAVSFPYTRIDGSGKSTLYEYIAN